MSPKSVKVKAAVTIRSKIPIPKKKLSNMHSYVQENVVSSTPAWKKRPNRIGQSSPILTSKNANVIRWSVSPIKKCKPNDIDTPASYSPNSSDVKKSKTSASTISPKYSMVVCSTDEDEDAIFYKNSPKRKIQKSKVIKKSPVDVFSTKETNSNTIENISNSKKRLGSKINFVDVVERKIRKSTIIEEQSPAESVEMTHNLIKNTKRKFKEDPNKLNTLTKSARISINKNEKRNNIVQIKKTKQNKNLSMTSKLDYSKGPRKQVQNAGIVTESNLKRNQKRTLTNKKNYQKNKISKNSTLTETAKHIDENKNNNQPEINMDVIPEIASSIKNKYSLNEQIKRKPKLVISILKTKKSPNKKSIMEKERIQIEEQIQNKIRKTNRKKSNNKDLKNIDISLEQIKKKPKHIIDKKLVINTLRTKKSPNKKSIMEKERIQKEGQIQNKVKKTNRRKSNNKDLKNIDISLEKQIYIASKPNDIDDNVKNKKDKIDLKINSDHLEAVRRSSRTRYHVKQFWVSNSVLRAQ